MESVKVLPSQMSVGTVPLGLIFKYSGSKFLP